METLFLLNWLFSDGLLVQNFHSLVIFASMLLIVIGVTFVMIMSMENYVKSKRAYGEMLEELIRHLGGRQAKRARERAEEEQARAARERVEEERKRQEKLIYQRCEECVSNFWDDFQNSDETTEVLLSRLKF